MGTEFQNTFKVTLSSIFKNHSAKNMEFDTEKKSLRENEESREDEIELFTEPAPCYAIFMHWPICSGREIMWGCISAIGIPMQVSLGIPVGIAALNMACSAVYA